MTGQHTGPVQVGARIDDLCRACKSIRPHTVSAADAAGRPVRVVCDTCNSHHNWRGGDTSAPSTSRPERAALGQAARPVVVIRDPERNGADMSDTRTQLAGEGIETLLRRVLQEELGLTDVSLAPRWRRGTLVLKPGREGTQEKEIPVETFFKKIVMVRNRLRSLEQQVNASDLPGDVKLKMQGYITACYGSLTTFNVLFADRDERFSGAGSSSG